MRMTAALAAVICLAGSASAAQAQDQVLQTIKTDSKNIQVLHVRGNVYMLVEPLVNVTVQVGEQYVIVVDPGAAELGDEVVSIIRSLTSLPILFVVNTSSDKDRTGADLTLSNAGWALPNAGDTGTNPEVADALINHVSLVPSASVVGHTNTINRMSEAMGKLATSAINYGHEGFKLYNNEPVVFQHMPAAHSDGDTLVFFRGSDVISVGGLFSTTSYPVIEPERGGTIDGFIDSLNAIIAITVPHESEEGGTYVIPGRGHLCDRNDVVDYRDMVTIIRGRIQAMIKKGMTLDQVKAAKPTFDYDPLYGAKTGPWTTDMFVEAVYRGLNKDKTMPGRKQ
jgi:glyoxylase-like metal-dependent hydrolase (beta-lactamase superfamily II)